jgi:hypothetical protein
VSGYCIIGSLGPYRATRCGVEGTVTMREDGPQYGAFHPGGDESVSIPIIKWDSDTAWWEPCSYCGESCETCFANIDAGGPAHMGCMGYPYCQCAHSHTGDCS